MKDLIALIAQNALHNFEGNWSLVFHDKMLSMINPRNSVMRVLVIYFHGLYWC